MIESRWKSKPLKGVLLDRSNSLTRDIAALYLFNEQAGLRVEDVASPTYGTATTSTAWTSSPIGPAISFTGGRVILDTHASLNIAGPITLAAWIIPTTLGVNKHVIGGYKATSAFDGYGLDLTATGFQFWQGTAWQAGANSLTANVPAWITATHDGTNARMYANGRLINTTVCAAPNLYTGTRTIGAASGGANAFSGVIGMVGIWSRALNSDEVMELHAAPYSLMTPQRIYLTSFAKPWIYASSTQVAA